LREMPAGPFPYALAAVIERTPNFVPILTPGSLKKKEGGVDYFDMEIDFAFKFQRNIVPLRDESMEPVINGQIARANDLASLHQIAYSNSYPDASIEALDKRLCYERGNQQEIGASKIPMIVSDHHRWGVTGTKKEVSFILNDRSHTIEYRRTAHPLTLRNEFNIVVDGRSIFSRRAFAFKVGKWTWDFYIDRTACRLETRFFLADVYFTKVYVGGVLVLDV